MGAAQGLTHLAFGSESRLYWDNEDNPSVQTVCVCTGPYAYAYHSTLQCPGLANCSRQINYVDENHAVYTMGRVPCCRCWNNVSGRCKEDNPKTSSGYGGGGDEDTAEAMAYVALILVVASAAVLSNDVYIHRSYSFIGEGSENWLGAGWTSGFKKNFDNGDLEYGVSYHTSGGSWQSSSYREIWGGHLNAIFPLLKYQDLYTLAPYFGSTINVFNDIGYGGIIGAEIALSDRISLDLRYELSTQTHQVQAGLIYNYQKEYFWKK
jgi:hypothetical protein